MALPASGPISFNDINVELGVAGTTQASLGQATYRTLAGVASGQISMSNFYGKANQFSFTISTGQTNANLRTLAINAGWNQSSKVVATISSGVIISSNSTGTPALTVSGSFPGGVELTNGGVIVGMGGAGGSGSGSGSGSAGSAGGLALSVSSTITITNNGTIAGGGGGGGGGEGIQTNQEYVGVVYAGGGGGGGGRSSNAANASGGSGGGSTGGFGAAGSGGSGTYASAGNGGTGAVFTSSGVRQGGNGGAGGDWGSSGSTGGSRPFSGQTSRGGPYSGGSGGGAVSGNSNITWVATGTRLGTIS